MGSEAGLLARPGTPGNPYQEDQHQRSKKGQRSHQTVARPHQASAGEQQAGCGTPGPPPEEHVRKGVRQCDACGKAAGQCQRRRAFPKNRHFCSHREGGLRRFSLDPLPPSRITSQTASARSASCEQAVKLCLLQNLCLPGEYTWCTLHGERVSWKAASFYRTAYVRRRVFGRGSDHE